MLDAAGDYSSSSSTECLLTAGSCSISRKKKKKSNSSSRRFSDDQIKSLETIFDTETKLVPNKKLQLAKELGLQPRQVAIWFQNKRARWKSKQLERDYDLLQSDYDNLLEQFQSLKKERQTLLDQLRKLNDLIDKPDAKEAGHEADGLVHEGYPNMNVKMTSGDDEPEVKNPMINEFLDLERREYGGALNVVVSEYDDDDGDDQKSRNIVDGYLGLEEETEPPININILEAAAAQRFKAEQEWGGFESDGLLDQPSNRYKWWDFWS